MKTNLKTALIMSAATVMTLAFAVSAQAQVTDTYNINVARSSGDMTCQIDTSNAGAESCSMNFNASSDIAIAMNPSKKGDSYVGVDKVQDGAQYLVLAVVADSTKTLSDVVLVRAQSTDSSFDGSIAVAQSASLQAVNIDPLHIDKIDDHTYKMTLSFVSYAPAKANHVLNEQDRIQLTDKIMTKVQPVISTLSH